VQIPVKTTTQALEDSRKAFDDLSFGLLLLNRLIMDIPNPTAILLVAHGSRDPRPQVTLNALAATLCQRLGVPVETAVLELGHESLAGQIQAFATRLLQAEPIVMPMLAIVPLFLIPGVHVCEDIPAEVAAAQAQVAIPIVLLPHVGGAIDFAALVRQVVTVPAIAPEATQGKPESVNKGGQEGEPDIVKGWEVGLMIAHGSRRLGAEVDLVAIADQLQTQLRIPWQLAYTSVAGQVETHLNALLAAGYQRILVYPHFLCAGSLTDMLTAQLATIVDQFEQCADPCTPAPINLHQLPTWGEQPDFAAQLAAWLSCQIQLPNQSLSQTSIAPKASKLSKQALTPAPTLSPA